MAELQPRGLHSLGGYAKLVDSSYGPSVREQVDVLFLGDDVCVCVGEFSGNVIDPIGWQERELTSRM